MSIPKQIEEKVLNNEVDSNDKEILETEKIKKEKKPKKKNKKLLLCIRYHENCPN